MLGYVIKKSAGKPNIGPGIGAVGAHATVKVYVGRTSEEAEKESTGAGDHVGVIAESKPRSVTTSNGVAPQGIVIEGSGRNVAKTDTTAAVLYSKNELSFDGLTFGTAEGEWTLGANNWPILNFPSGSPAQSPSIPTKPTNFQE